MLDDPNRFGGRDKNSESPYGRMQIIGDLKDKSNVLKYHEGHEEHEAEIIIYFLSLHVLHALHGENQTF
jgi:hypothetical protein